MNLTNHCLGVDIGRVIIHGDGPDTAFVGAATLEEALRAPALAGCFDALARLTLRLERRVWLVSKCGKRVEERTRLWLERRDFFQATGIPKDHLRFCRERKDKAPICVALGVTIFIDDRLDVLAHMANLVPLRLLFGAASCPEPAIVAVPDWAAVEARLGALPGELVAPRVRATEREHSS